jgi:hypothetical protein
MVGRPDPVGKKPWLAAGLNCIPIAAFFVAYYPMVALIAFLTADPPPPPESGQEWQGGLLLALFVAAAAFSGGLGYLYLGGRTARRYLVGFLGLPAVLLSGIIAVAVANHWLFPGDLIYASGTVKPLGNVLICVGGLVVVLVTAVDAWSIARGRFAHDQSPDGR